MFESPICSWTRGESGFIASSASGRGAGLHIRLRSASRRRGGLRFRLRHHCCDLVAHKADNIRPGLAAFRDGSAQHRLVLPLQAILVERHILRGVDRHHAGRRFGLIGLDPQDARMRAVLRTASSCAACPGQVTGIGCFARHLAAGIDTRERLAYYSCHCQCLMGWEWFMGCRNAREQRGIELSLVPFHFHADRRYIGRSILGRTEHLKMNP
jgi:hypothetical protein